MKNYHLKLSNKQKSVFPSVINLADGSRDIDGEVLSYFVGFWFKNMGYGTSRNKKYLHKIVELNLDSHQIFEFFHLYRQLDSLPLDIPAKRDFIIQTCKNGWQYFINFLLKTIFLNPQMCLKRRI